MASGIRVGAPAVTTRGMKEPETRQAASWVAEVLNNVEDKSTVQRVRSPVVALRGRFPPYEKRRVAARSKA